MEKTKRKFSSVFRAWLFSYISVLLVPLLISSIVQIESTKNYEKEINSVNAGMLKQVQQAMDSRLSDIDKLVQQISLNPEVNALLGARYPLSEFQRFNVYRVREDLKVYNASNSFIDNIYIYLRNSNTILTGSVHLEAELYYSYYETYDDMSYEQWKVFHENVTNKEFVALEQKKREGAGGKKIAYLYPMALGGPATPVATLVILMDERIFRRSIENINLTNQGIVMIIDQNNQVLTTTLQDEMPWDLSDVELAGKSGLLNTGINDEKVVISYITSEVCDWKYVSVIPARVFWEKMNYIRRLTNISLLLCLVIGGVVVFIFLRKNYHPINHIVQTLVQKIGISLDGRKNEYAFIEEVISRTFHEKEQIQQKLESHHKEICTNFLIRLLKGRIENTVSIHDTLVSLDISFYSEYFSVLLFYINNYGSFFNGENNMNENQKLKLVQFVLRNVVEELAQRKNQGYMLEIDDGVMACLVNLRKESIGEGKEQVFEIAYEAQQFIKNNFDINFTISVSSVHRTIAAIPQAYQEALIGMEYKMVVGTEQIICYDDIMDTHESKYSYHYPLETEYHLLNAIKAGDFGKSKKIVDEIFENNFSRKSISIQMKKCLMFNMVSTMVKTVNEVGEICKEDYWEELNIVDRLLGCKTVVELKSEMMAILEKICEAIVSNKRSCHGDLIEAVKEFVQHQYSDISLSISSIGDQFNMTPSYISKIFSEVCGEGLLDYINKIRLKKAKELLKKEVGYSIGETAAKVGFTSSTVFIRTFKKYEGITPGQFKEL